MTVGWVSHYRKAARYPSFSWNSMIIRLSQRSAGKMPGRPYLWRSTNDFDEIIRIQAQWLISSRSEKSDLVTAVPKAEKMKMMLTIAKWEGLHFVFHVVLHNSSSAHNFINSFVLTVEHFMALSVWPYRGLERQLSVRKNEWWLELVQRI